MSLFYIYEDEVGPNDAVSTTADCEACEEDCNVNHCLMTVLVKKEIK